MISFIYRQNVDDIKVRCHISQHHLDIASVVKENESEVLDAVSSQPRVAALKGNPRRLIELANDLDHLSAGDDLDS